MPITTAATKPTASATRRAEGRFSIGMAIAATATAIAGFGPAIVDPASRKAPLTWVVGLHGAAFSAWLLLFLTQTLLASNGRIAVHRRLGYVGALFAVLMVVSGYAGDIRGHCMPQCGWVTTHQTAVSAVFPIIWCCGHWWTEK